jgi:hypothetical protein
MPRLFNEIVHGIFALPTSNDLHAKTIQCAFRTWRARQRGRRSSWVRGARYEDRMAMFF